MLKVKIFNYINYMMKMLMLLMWMYLFYMGSLTLNRMMMFIMVFLLMYTYSSFSLFMNYMFLNEKLTKYVEDNKVFFFKMLYVLLEMHSWMNPFMAFLVYTDKWLYRINSYVTGTQYMHYNFIVYVLFKYMVFFGLVKFIMYKFYNFWYKLYHLTMAEMLFKSMYGLMLSILMFTDLLNNVMNVLSQYNVLMYVLMYYVLSMLCMMWELLFFYYMWDKMIYFNMKYKKDILSKMSYLMILFDNNFQEYMKMDMMMFLSSEFTWLGRMMTDFFEMLVPEENNFKEDYLSITKVSEGSFFISGRMNYYKPVENRMSFKYFDYFLGHMDHGVFEPTFKLYWESFKYKFNYDFFFKPMCEIKHKPSMFLYKNMQELAKFHDMYNQPMNRLMNWFYFEMKFSENNENFNEDESFIMNKSLKYFNEVDDLSAKLMFFMMWDMEHYYNNDYKWNYWIMQFNAMADLLIFLMDKKLKLQLLFNNNELKFYDPEENMEFLNSLFDVLGVMNYMSMHNKYYVSKKFMNYNKNYVELLTMMYTYDYKSWEEPLCECSYLSNYEVEMVYKTEEYFYQLSKEWEGSMTKEPLEERNWRLLKCLEDLMVKEF